MANYSLREVFKQFGKKIFGSCVNSCVSESQNLPLAASQGKVLQDQITQLNSNKTNCFTYSVEADDVRDFIKKAVMKIGTISDGTFTVRGAWVGHDYFFMSGLAYKDDLVLGFIYTPANNVCGVIQALLKQDKINYRQFKI